jgi:hypothetical protein
MDSANWVAFGILAWCFGAGLVDLLINSLPNFIQDFFLNPVYKQTDSNNSLTQTERELFSQQKKKKKDFQTNSTQRQRHRHLIGLDVQFYNTN